MRCTRAILQLVIVIGLTVCAFGGAEDSLSSQHVADLRRRGPEGLEQLLNEHLVDVARGPRKDDANWQRLSDAIDAIAMQKDAWASRLYWYTDLNRAKAVAAKEDKPILSLRLLGKLDEELSCANSRFFRTTLYPDPRVGELLREKFILHWISERPVPVVTVDYGDGRKMTRTVTGNSVHYILDSDGRPIDALPGLYSASAFVRGLEAALALAAEKPTDDRLRAWHGDAADRAAKAQAEVQPEPFAPEVERVIRVKAAPPAREAGRLAISKRFVEDPLVVLIAGLQQSVAQDTRQNEFVLHRQIHQWFAAGAVRDFNAFNQRVYAELFLTPGSDPWLGLAPADAFTALQDGGLAQK
ncbi:MAG: hypothetical protein ABIP55_05605 [Tepidisphaeraceae bacterium]